MLGLIPLWKYAQKKLEKNITSDVMNRSIPIFSPLDTVLRCSPSFFLSLIVSIHHIHDAIIIGIAIIFSPLLTIFPVIILTIVDTILHALRDDTIGQGLLVTIWNG